MSNSEQINLTDTSMDTTHHALNMLLSGLSSVLHSGKSDLSGEAAQDLQGLYWDTVNRIKEAPTLNEGMPLARATTYTLPDGSKLEEVKSAEQFPRWAIRDGVGMCLNKQGEWEYEPQPSNRDDAFYSRCRWDTVEDAYESWKACRPSLSVKHPGL